ncbi:MAG TPA: MIP/aquaporin family protein [Pirellulaceae bacterium]|nr:MIP/aquaporin family protein [Pirellulaceae bacterium]
MSSSLRTFLAEALGTFILILFGCGAVHSAVLTGAQSGLWQVAIVWGMGVTLAAYCVGGVSGAHINPAMTIALAVWGRFPWSNVGPYIVAQLAGAILAAATLFVIYGPSLRLKEEKMGVKRGELGSIVTASCYGEFYPAPGGVLTAEGKWSEAEWRVFQARATFQEAFIAEVLCTAVLALVVFAVTDNKNSAAPASYFAPLIIGLTVASLISIIAPLTQCCLNPARDFGPRLFTYFAGWGTAALPGPNGHGVVTVYILAPILGAIAGGGIYDKLIRPSFILPPES